MARDARTLDFARMSRAMCTLAESVDVDASDLQPRLVPAGR